MKKTNFFSMMCVCTRILLLLVIQQVAMAQVPKPDEWSNFVNSSLNQEICDTFQIQTFNNASTDNWPYTITGNTELIDASLFGFQVKEGDLSLKLPAGSSLHLSDISSDNYKKIKAYGKYAAYQLAQGEKLFISAKRTEKPISNHEWLTPKDNYTADFSSSKADNLSQNAYLAVDNPINLTFSVGTASEMSHGGFYAFDSIFVTGNIPEYSLYSGNGDWQNTSSWSHLPALRHRSAYIQGEVSISSDTQCKEVHIGEGSLVIRPNSTFTASKLFLYFSYNSLIKRLYAYTNLISQENSYSFLINRGSFLINFLQNTYNLLINEGEFHLAGSATLEMSYPEKGKWYFISLPFDVYAEGIDPDFQYRDDTEKGSGNFFYLQTYNGEKRAIRQSSTGNWEVISQTILSTDQPLLKKNKGYLIAIDSEATSSTLRFTSRTGEIPSDFGRNGVISIQASSSGLNDVHAGWYLCGNPLPSSLPLSSISSNSSLDGNVYIYDGNDYRAYSLNGSEVLPPFSAFFVKAKHDTKIEVSLPTTTSLISYSPVPYSATLNNLKVEPEVKGETTTSIRNTNHPDPQCFVSNNKLHLINMHSAGKLIIQDLTGRLLSISTIEAGTSCHSLHLSPGTYILRIEAKHYRNRMKYIQYK